MRSRSKLRPWWLLGGALVVVAGDAHAIIGRPLTPVSVAGVARRSVRRSAYYGAAAYGAAGYGYGAPVYGAPAAVPVLPAGCYPNVPCAGTVYHPAYSGTSVVYTPY